MPGALIPRVYLHALTARVTVDEPLRLGLGMSCWQPSDPLHASTYFPEVD
jgi:hypothetical protein